MSISSSAIFNGSLTLAGLILGLHGLLLWAAPFESVYPTAPAISILAIFFSVFFSSAKLMLAIGGRRGGGLLPARGVSLEEVFADTRLQRFLVVFASLGVGLHIWSKYYLTGLHPITCISEIRFAWLAVDRQALPTSVRIGSVLGHLFTSFAYLGILAASFNISVSAGLKSIKRKDLALQLLFTLAGVLYAGFIGSRNAMLAFLVMSLIGVMLAMGSSAWSERGRPWTVLATGLLLPFVSSIVFSSVIFSDRLFCYEPEALVKLEGQGLSAKKIAAYHMTGNYREFALIPRTSDSESNWRETLFADRCSICGSTMVYLNHGIFNLSRVLASEARGDPVLFNFFSSLVKRLGLDAVSPKGEGSKRVYGPGGVSLAGAAYHDFGAIGMVSTAMVLGLLFGQAILWIRFTGIRLMVGVWLFSCLFYVLLISNMFVGFSVLPFPFIAFGIGAGFAAWLVMRGVRGIR